MFWESIRNRLRVECVGETWEDQARMFKERIRILRCCFLFLEGVCGVRMHSQDFGVLGHHAIQVSWREHVFRLGRGTTSILVKDKHSSETQKIPTVYLPSSLRFDYELFF